MTQHSPFVSFLFLFLIIRRKNRLKYLKNMGDFPIFFSCIWNKIFLTRAFLLMFWVCFMSFAVIFLSAWETLLVLLYTMPYRGSCPVLFYLKFPSYEHYIKKHIKYPDLVLKFHIMLSNWKSLFSLSYLFAMFPHSQMPKKIGTCFQHYFLGNPLFED